MPLIPGVCPKWLAFTILGFPATCIHPCSCRTLLKTHTPLLFLETGGGHICFGGADPHTSGLTLDLRAAALVYRSDTPAIESSGWWVGGVDQCVGARRIPCHCYWPFAALGWFTCPSSAPRWKAWRLPLALWWCAPALRDRVPSSTWGFKENWQRARPYQVENFGGTQQFSRATVMTDQCDNQLLFCQRACGLRFLLQQPDAYPGCVRRKWWLIGGYQLPGLAIGFSRMSAVAHWFSDVLWAGPITLMTSWLVWKYCPDLRAVW